MKRNRIIRRKMSKDEALQKVMPDIFKHRRRRQYRNDYNTYAHGSYRNKQFNSRRYNKYNSNKSNENKSWKWRQKKRRYTYH